MRFTSQDLFGISCKVTTFVGILSSFGMFTNIRQAITINFLNLYSLHFSFSSERNMLWNYHDMMYVPYLIRFIRPKILYCLVSCIYIKIFHKLFYGYLRINTDLKLLVVSNYSNLVFSIDISEQASHYF